MFSTPSFWLVFAAIFIVVCIVMYFISYALFPIQASHQFPVYKPEGKPGIWTHHDEPTKAPPGATFHFGSEDTVYGLRIMEVRGDTTSARMDYWRIDLGWNSTESVTLSEYEMQTLIDTVI